MASKEDYCFDILRRATTHLCTEAGFERNKDEPFKVLTSASRLYMENLAKHVSESARHHGREANLLDFSYAFKRMRINEEDLASFAEENSATDLHESLNVPMFPKGGKVLMTKPSARELRERPAHIEDWMPALPGHPEWAEEEEEEEEEPEQEDEPMVIASPTPSTSATAPIQPGAPLAPISPSAGSIVAPARPALPDEARHSSYTPRNAMLSETGCILGQGKLPDANAPPTPSTPSVPLVLLDDDDDDDDESAGPRFPTPLPSPSPSSSLPALSQMSPPAMPYKTKAELKQTPKAKAKTPKRLQTPKRSPGRPKKSPGPRKSLSGLSSPRPGSAATSSVLASMLTSPLDKMNKMAKQEETEEARIRRLDSYIVTICDVAAEVDAKVSPVNKSLTAPELHIIKSQEQEIDKEEKSKAHENEIRRLQEKAKQIQEEQLMRDDKERLREEIATFEREKRAEEEARRRAVNVDNVIDEVASGMDISADEEDDDVIIESPPPKPIPSQPIPSQPIPSQPIPSQPILSQRKRSVSPPPPPTPGIIDSSSPRRRSVSSSVEREHSSPSKYSSRKSPSPAKSQHQTSPTKYRTPSPVKAPSVTSSPTKRKRVPSVSPYRSPSPDDIPMPSLEAEASPPPPTPAAAPKQTELLSPPKPATDDIFIFKAKSTVEEKHHHKKEKKDKKEKKKKKDKDKEKHKEHKHHHHHKDKKHKEVAEEAVAIPTETAPREEEDQPPTKKLKISFSKDKGDQWGTKISKSPLKLLAEEQTEHKKKEKKKKKNKDNDKEHDEDEKRRKKEKKKEKKEKERAKRKEEKRKEKVEKENPVKENPVKITLNIKGGFSVANTPKSSPHPQEPLPKLVLNRNRGLVSPTPSQTSLSKLVSSPPPLTISPSSPHYSLPSTPSPTKIPSAFPPSRAMFESSESDGSQSPVNIPEIPRTPSPHVSRERSPVKSKISRLSESSTSDDDSPVRISSPPKHRTVSPDKTDRLVLTPPPPPSSSTSSRGTPGRPRGRGRGRGRGRPPTTPVRSGGAMADLFAPDLPPPPPSSASVSETSPSKGPGRPKKTPTIVSETQGKIVDNDGNVVWICPTCKRKDDGTPMVGCDGCDDWYHWACEGITSEPPEDEKWFCPRCKLQQGKQAPPPPSSSASKGKGKGRPKGRPPKKKSL